MALPPQAIEKLIREPSHTQGAYRELLLISGALFGLMIFVYVGLAFGYRAYLKSSLAKVDDQIKNFNAGISQEDRVQIQGFYSQLVNLRTLLGAHTVASPVANLLERTVQPNIYYTKMTMNAVTNQVVLTGAARTLEDIALQAASMEIQPEVDHLNFNNAGAQAAGPWQFTMTIFLKPNVLHGAVITTPTVDLTLPSAFPTTTPVTNTVIPSSTPL